MGDKDKDLRCGWDGDISTFPDYVRRVRLIFEKTRRRRRKHLGPDLVAQLTGRAWVITQEIDHTKLTQDDGARYLVDFLEEKLARVPVPDAGVRAEELLVRLRRPPGNDDGYLVRNCQGVLQEVAKGSQEGKAGITSAD